MEFYETPNNAFGTCNFCEENHKVMYMIGQKGICFDCIKELKQILSVDLGE